MSDESIKNCFDKNAKFHEKEQYKLSDSEISKLAHIEQAYEDKAKKILSGQIKPPIERVEEIKQEILRKQGRPQLSMECSGSRPRFNPALLNSMAERRAVSEMITELNIQRDNDIKAITGQQLENSEEKSMANIFNGNSFNAAEHSRGITRSDKGREDDGRER